MHFPEFLPEARTSWLKGRLLCCAQIFLFFIFPCCQIKFNCKFYMLWSEWEIKKSIERVRQRERGENALMFLVICESSERTLSRRARKRVCEGGKEGGGGGRVDNIDLNTCKHIWLSVIQLFCSWWKRRRGSCIDQRKQSEFNQSVVQQALKKQLEFLLAHCVSQYKGYQPQTGTGSIMRLTLCMSVLYSWACIAYTLVIKLSVLHI